MAGCTWGGGGQGQRPGGRRLNGIAHRIHPTLQSIRCGRRVTHIPALPEESCTTGSNLILQKHISFSIKFHLALMKMLWGDGLHQPFGEGGSCLSLLEML